MTELPTAARPAEPFADAKARVAAAVEAARDELIGLSHRIHANPEPAFEEVQASAWCADSCSAWRAVPGGPSRLAWARISAASRRGLPP